jgi:hypothetical protein
MSVAAFPAMLVINIISVFAGGILCFLYLYGCDPLLADQINNENQVGTFWLFTIFAENGYPAFTGLLFASMVCFSIVQHSMGIALCGNTCYAEIVYPMFLSRWEMSEKVNSRIKLIITVVVGLASVGLAFLLQFVKSTILSLLLIFNNSINAPIFGLFILSAFNPYANHVKNLFLVFFSSLFFI